MTTTDSGTQPAGGTQAPTTPMVGIVMGSSSDAPIMSAAADQLRKLGVPSEMRVLSAHRTPDDTAAYARGAAQRGIRILIAGAGGAAHLPGVIAAMTDLPVIGVPIALAHLDGLDSLLSIVQMPKGVPVATVGVNAALNAGLLASRILALSDDQIAAKLTEHRAQQADKVRSQDTQVRSAHNGA